ncbi:MAG TPA: sulfite exporter TauE/SafE family protein [Quisquiliibacterium sp.]|nr:sulfite exporter TauE/SafE family protein [Quisquiliibacterium sp.]
MEHAIALSLTGFAVGMIVGMTGVGGGSLMTPALVGIFRINPAIAVGTDLAFAALTKAVGTRAHMKYAGVDREVVRLMLIGSLPAAMLAMLWLKFGGMDPGAAGRMLRVAIAVSLGLTVVVLLWRDRLMEWRRGLGGEMSEAARRGITITAAAVIGALVALSSIGAGAIGCVAIALIHPRLSAREVAATDIAYAVPLTALTATGHAMAGNLDLALLLQLLIGSVPGIILGARLSVRLPDRVSRRLLAGALVVAAVKTVA